MKEAMRRSDTIASYRESNTRKQKRRAAVHCSICTRRVWFNPAVMEEPQEAPEPHLSWTLCKRCHEALLLEMQRSPVHSPLRLRIAMGMVAAERWPLAYSTRVNTYINDHKWIIFIALSFIIAMLAHLFLIVMVAGMR